MARLFVVVVVVLFIMGRNGVFFPFGGLFIGKVSRIRGDRWVEMNGAAN